MACENTNECVCIISVLDDIYIYIYVQPDDVRAEYALQCQRNNTLCFVSLRESPAVFTIYGNKQ